MRWKSGSKYTDGFIKVKNRFLWFPVELNNEWRWLERAEIRYRFNRQLDYWIVQGWANK